MNSRKLGRFSFLLALGALAGVLATACGQAPAPTQAPASSQAPAAAQKAAPAAQSPMKIRIGYNKTWTTPFLLIAKNQGAFQKAGVEVEWVEFQAPPQAIEAMAAGSVDAAVSPGTNVFTAAEKGVDAKITMHLSGWSDPTSGYFVRVDSGINSVKDLKGKKIGVNNYGGSFDLYLRHMLEQNGLDPKNDVQILEIPIAAVLQALDTKQIDMGALPPLFVPVAEEKFPGKFKPLFSYRDIPGVKDRPQFNQLVLVMSGNFLKNSRPAATAFEKAILDAQNAAYADPATAAKQWATEAGVPGLATQKDPFGPNSKGQLDLPALELDANLISKYGYVKKPVVVKDIVDGSIIEGLNTGK